MHEIVKGLADINLEKIKKQGHADAGHNGPYKDYETPIRNTAHWLITFSALYKNTKEEKYLEGVEICGKYLLLEKHRPCNATFHCRNKDNKDKCNGLIGQAWVIEALCEAYELTRLEKYIDLAKEVFLLHPFEPKKALWKIVEIDGQVRNFDGTFNHQLWFAAIGSILANKSGDSEISAMVEMFIEKIEVNGAIYENGLVKHPLVTNNKDVSILRRCYRMLRTAKTYYKKKKHGFDEKYKENGYHLFNMYAFALMKNESFGDQFYQSERFEKMLEYSFSQELEEWLLSSRHELDPKQLPFDKKINVNRYGFSYNAPGFELPYIYRTFSYLVDSKKEFVDRIMEKQIDLTYCSDKNSFCNNNEDSSTLDARLYEYIRGLE